MVYFEYFTYVSDRARNHNLSQTGNYVYKETFSVFSKNILEYVNTHEPNIQTTSSNYSAISCETPSTPQTEEKDNEFFEYLKTLPAVNFIKGSEECKKISKQMEEYIKNLSIPYIEKDYHEEEIDKIIDRELEKYRAIIDAKRAENATNEKREAIRKHAFQRIEDGVKYHHEPKSFEHNNNFPKHQRFQTKDREL